MLSEQKLLEMLSKGTLQEKYEALDQILASPVSSVAMVEALEKATHDDDMGIVVRAIKALQSGVHHQMAVEIGFFGSSKPSPEERIGEAAPVPQELPVTRPTLPPPGPGNDLSSQTGLTPLPENQGTSSASIHDELPIALLPPPASVFRRGAALLIDLLILTVLTTAIGLIFSSLLERLSFYARLLSGLLALIYFSVSNSTLLGGATPGKRITRLYVSGGDGKLITFQQALLRSMVLVLFILFYGWQVPGQSTNGIVSLLIDVAVYGVGAAILYLILFNRQSGQSLDDLLIGTRVVYATGKPVEKYSDTPRRQKYGAIITLIALPALVWGATQVVQKSTAVADSSQPLFPLYQALNRDPRLYRVGISEAYQGVSAQQLVKTLVITLWPRNYLDDSGRQQIAEEAANLVTDNAALANYHGLQVQIIGGYDLGFFKQSIAWLCAPPAKCSAKIVQNTLLRYLNFTLNYQLAK